jgi:hypothetical protein
MIELEPYQLIIIIMLALLVGFGYGFSFYAGLKNKIMCGLKEKQKFKSKGR